MMTIIKCQKKLHTELRKEIEPIMHIQDKWPLNLLTNILKEQIYMILTRLAVTNVCETWT